MIIHNVTKTKMMYHMIIHNVTSCDAHVHLYHQMFSMACTCHQTLLATPSTLSLVIVPGKY